MSYVRTFPGLISKRLQYVEETTYGTVPTTPTFISAGKIKRLSFNIDAAVERYRSLGLRTVCSFLQTGQMYSFEIEYSPFDIDLLARGINNPNGTGTIEKSLSFLYSKLINGTEYYYILKGAKTDQITIEITKEAVNVTQSFLCREVTTPTTSHGLTTPTFASAPTGVPWTGKDGGDDPLTYDGSSYDTPRFNLEVAWNLDPGQPNGQTLIKFLDPTNKDVNCDFDVWLKDTTFIAALKSNDEVDISYSMNDSSSADLAITDFHSESYDFEEDADSNEMSTEPVMGGAKDVSVSES